MTGLAYIDGTVCPLHEARIPLTDRGHLLGDGVFETVRVSNGRPFRLDLHAARMGEGLRMIGLEPELSDEFRAAVDALVAAARESIGDDLYVRVQISTGPMEDLNGDRGVLVSGLCRPFKPYPLEYLNRGVHVILSSRTNDRWDPLNRVKSLSFLPHVTARREAHAQAAHDAILRNDAGRVAEATTSNVFALHQGTVFAPGPDEGALAGVTRQVALELVRGEGLNVVERLPMDTLFDAEEVWLTNTTGGAVPVVRVGERTVGGGVKGPLTARLQHDVESMVRGG